MLKRFLPILVICLVAVSAHASTSPEGPYFAQAMGKNEKGSFLFFGFKDGGIEGYNRNCEAEIFRDNSGDAVFYFHGGNLAPWSGRPGSSKNIGKGGRHVDRWRFSSNGSRYFRDGYVYVSFDASNKVAEFYKKEYEYDKVIGSDECFLGDRAHRISTQIVTIDRNNKRWVPDHSLKDANLYLEDSLLSPDVISVDYIVKSYVASGKKLILKKELHLNSKDLSFSKDPHSQYRYVKKLTKKTLGLSFNNRNIVITISGTKKLRNIDGTERSLTFSTSEEIERLNETLTDGLINKSYLDRWRDSEFVASPTPEACVTWEQCQQLIASADARIEELYKNRVPEFSDIAKSADGKVDYMGHSEAKAYCASQGMHLPSAREFAQFAQRFGAAEVSETPRSGYEQIASYSFKPTKLDDIFYFNNAGYERPSNYFGKHWFWSSSLQHVARACWEAPTTVYTLNGNTGRIFLDNADCYNDVRAVLCIKEPVSNQPSKVNNRTSNVCNTLTECRQLKAAADAVMEARGWNNIDSQFSGIATHTDESVNYMPHGVAIEYCAKRGMHLPSIRELALLGQYRGADGISETSSSEGPGIFVKNYDGTHDQFDYSSEGYRRSSNGNELWSSSRSLYANGHTPTFNENDGRIGYADWTQRKAVRCVFGR